MKYLHRQYEVDGALGIVFPDLSWTLSLSCGIVERGQAESLDDAKAAIETAYTRDVMKRWRQMKRFPRSVRPNKIK